jgi:UDP-N-acetylglucosamine 2-epimerase (non-hydrolysing)
MKILVVVGTRPEAIKMAPLINKMKQNGNFEIRVCNTGQHKEILDQIMDVFGIQPEYNLSIMRVNQSLSSITTEIITQLNNVFAQFLPDYVLVHGDTTTAAAASIASFYNKIPIGHVEAGLRTGDINSPWPEEANRKIISVVAKMHFAPTENSMKNLLKEGVNKQNICVTGNTVIDALFEIVKKIKDKNDGESEFVAKFPFYRKDKKLILVTGHRRENIGDGFADVCNALIKIAKLRTDVQIVYPVHPNPLVRETVITMLGKVENIFLIEPLEYISFIELMMKSYLIMTDSGGIQEEAPSLGKPVLVLRDNTERPEALSAGTVRLVGTSIDLIIKNTILLLDNLVEYEKMSLAKNPYGDGSASSKIIDALISLK